MAEIGPVEYMAVSFPGNKFKGEIVPALKELVDRHGSDHRSRLRDQDATAASWPWRWKNWTRMPERRSPRSRRKSATS
jgi:hypothetical protein